jgi:hypothetical protein
MKMKPPSGYEKTNPNKPKTNPISNPVLSAVEWANFKRRVHSWTAGITKNI